MYMPDKVYDVLKWVAVVAIYAVTTAFSAIARAWGLSMDIVTPVVVTLNAIGTLLGTLIGVSAVTYKNKQ